MSAAIAQESWVTWSPNGRDPYYNPKSRRAHLVAEHNGYDAQTACGIYVDSDHARMESSNAPRCRRCEQRAKRQA